MQRDFGVTRSRAGLGKRGRSRVCFQLFVALIAAQAGLGCGARSTFDFAFDIDPDPPAPPLPEVCSPPAGACKTRTCEPPVVAAEHVEMCSEIAFTSNPPTSGPHYPIWGLFKTYEKPLARGFYLHDAEHSGVILLYNCKLFASEDECAETVATLNAYVAEKPADPKCDEPTHNRIILTPDPELDVPYAAVAWGYSLKSDCFDRGATDAFIDAHYGKNYEDFCSGGIDPTDPDAGILDGCGFF